MPYKSDYWRNPGREPIDYASISDPLHGDNFEDSREEFLSFAKEATEYIGIWLSDHSLDLEVMLNNIKIRWFSAGGNNDTWKSILLKAYVDSRFALMFSKEANAIELNNTKEINNRGLNAKKNKPKKPFNGLDFSNL